MILYEQEIKGLFLIKPLPFKDERGSLRRVFCEKVLKKNKIDFKLKQSNISENKKKFTLRGFHSQKEPYGESKIISCISGKIYNVVIDLRKSSKTKYRHQSFRLSDKNKLSLLVPKGCANAYLTLTENTKILYFHSEFYSPGNELNVHFDDPFFKIKWPSKPKIISEKDLSIKFLKK